MRTTSRTLATLGATGALAIAPLALATPVSAQPIAVGNLVNVQVELENNEILSRNNIAVAAAVQLVANVCPAVNVSDINVLANDGRTSTQTQTIDCEAVGDTVTTATATFSPAQRPGRP